ncbi:WhiB family transcriptional regulator [Amycolatopsis sp. CA-230715]|uniref:WhiB family transcriptional regulator n=1 Tax=Amycolatopsis sp. CA-230715 TaxID=2745196 RepID=UPI001C340E28|nr:WhiB family transcriptional regulator [Amycolatopsis sp. CA-230715]QWF81941.1 Transcriptional regulator WhiB [Amycolatopsis sp. CA-230715]
MTDEQEYGEFAEQAAARLDHLEVVPSGVLLHVVTRDGACMWFTAGTDNPECPEDGPEREVAAAICGDCPVRDECLELEFRTAGYGTVGVWGALAEDDRRAAYLAWTARRDGGRS